MSAMDNHSAADFTSSSLTTEPTDANLHRNKTGCSKAFKTLGLDASHLKKQKMLGINEEELDLAMQQVLEQVAEGPIVCSALREIPAEQLAFQAHGNNQIDTYQELQHQFESESPSLGESEDDGQMTLSPTEDEATKPEEVGLDSETKTDTASSYSDKKTYLQQDGMYEEEGGPNVSSDNLSSQNLTSFSLYGKEGMSIQQRQLVHHPNAYFYYYFDQQENQFRRRKASFDGEKTPMIDKVKYKKALSLLGLDPSSEKIMELLGIDHVQDLELAIADARSSALLKDEDLPCLTDGRADCSKACATLGLPTLPTKADKILGRDIDLEEDWYSSLPLMSLV